MANDKWQITNNKWMFKKAMTAKANPPHILFTNNKWQMEIDNKNKGQMTKNKWQNSNGFHRNTNTARAAKFKYVTHPYQLEYQQPGKRRGSRSAKLLWGSSFRQIGSLQPYACFSQCQIHTCVCPSIFSPTAHLRRGKDLGLSKLWKHALWNFDKGVWNNSLGVSNKL